MKKLVLAALLTGILVFSTNACEIGIDVTGIVPDQSRASDASPPEGRYADQKKATTNVFHFETAIEAETDSTEITIGIPAKGLAVIPVSDAVRLGTAAFLPKGHEISRCYAGRAPPIRV